MSLKNILISLFKEKYEEEEMETVVTKESESLGKKVSFSLLAIGLVILFVFALQSLIVPILFSIILAATLYPLCKLLEKWRFTRAMASLTSLIVGLIIFTGFGYVLVSQSINIGQDASEIVGKIETVLKRGEIWANETFQLSRSDLIAQGKEQLEKI